MLTDEIVDFLAPQHIKNDCDDRSFQNNYTENNVYVCNRCTLKYNQYYFKHLGKLPEVKVNSLVLVKTRGVV